MNPRHKGILCKLTNSFPWPPLGVNGKDWEQDKTLENVPFSTAANEKGLSTAAGKEHNPTPHPETSLEQSKMFKTERGRRRESSK